MAVLSQKFVSSGNPLFDGADPDILIADGKYWIYPTDGTGLVPPGFLVYSSPDLKNWTKSGPVLSFSNVGWIDDDGAAEHFAWAPAPFRKDSKFYLYYAVGPQGRTPSRIGVAVGMSPGGIFDDSGRPLLTGSRDFEAIDPMIFEVKSGQVYLYAGGSAGSTLRVYELGADLIAIAREIPVETPPNFTEAPYMNERHGIFYLSYSHGHWYDASYCVHYCTAPSPLGPWNYQGAILTSTSRRWGPGHHAIFAKPGTDQWYIIYHRWNETEAGQKPAGRSVCVDIVEFDSSGAILPVIMTDEGVGTC